MTLPIPINNPNDPATERQVAYILQLLTDAFPDDAEREEKEDLVLAEESSGKLTKRRASAMIERLKEIRKKTNPKYRAVTGRKDTGLDLSPLDGRYAAMADDGELRFVRVRHVQKEGSRWYGFRFVDIQSSDDHYPLGVQPPGQTYRGDLPEVLRNILANPKEAALRYGRELGICSVCGRTLTDAESRKRGIGPICAERIGV